MRSRLFALMGMVVFMAGVAAAADPIRVESVEYREIPQDEYAAFVKNWNGDGPLCAVIRSPADWEKYMGAAVVQGNKKPVAPDAKFFEKEQIVLVSRVTPALPEDSEEMDPLMVRSFISDADGQELTYRFQPPQKGASFSVKATLMLAVSKKYKGPFLFVEERVADIVK